MRREKVLLEGAGTTLANVSLRLCQREMFDNLPPIFIKWYAAKENSQENSYVCDHTSNSEPFDPFLL